MTIEDEIYDIVSDPESELYSLVSFKPGVAYFNAPVAIDVMERLERDDVEAEDKYTLRWEAITSG